MMPRIVVAGVSSLYLPFAVPEFPVAYRPTATPSWTAAGVAGAGLHIARVLKSLGDDVRLCTVVGRDPAGVAIHAELARLGLIGPGTIETEESSLGAVLVAPDGRRMGFPHLAPANRIEFPVEVLLAEARWADLLVLTTAGFVRPLLGPAGRLGIPIAVDAHLMTDPDGDYHRPWLEAAHIVFCSHEKLPVSPAEWPGEVFRRHPRCQIVGVGLGERGALVGLSDGQLIEVAPPGRVEVVNTAGAGDALFSTFLHGWLRTRDPVQALQLAVVHACWKIGHRMPAEVALSGPELSALRDRARPVTRVGRWDGPSAVAAGF